MMCGEVASAEDAKSSARQHTGCSMVSLVVPVLLSLSHCAPAQPVAVGQQADCRHAFSKIFTFSVTNSTLALSDSSVVTPHETTVSTTNMIAGVAQLV